MKPYRDTLTVTRQEDGKWQVKMHGYPFFWFADTASDALREAGRAIDAMEAQRAKMLEALGDEVPVVIGIDLAAPGSETTVETTWQGGRIIGSKVTTQGEI